MWQSAKWIWINDKDEPNRYVRFLDSFDWRGNGPVKLKISCDSNYALWVNGKFVSFGQYSDYPSDKVYDELDLTANLSAGKNMLAVLVWYYGIETQQYKKGNAGLIYEVMCENDVLCSSDERTRCQIAPDYRTEDSVCITVQLGWNFTYDATRSDGWEMFQEIPNDYQKAVVRIMPATFSPRPNQKLRLGTRVRGRLLCKKYYRIGNGKTLSQGLQNATECSAEIADGETLIFDLGQEECGFLELELSASQETPLFIAYGEHLSDGKVRHLIDQFDSVRNFYVEYIARQGKQCYRNPFRRLACRYLQVYIPKGKDVEFDFIGICPTDYPVIIKPYCAETKFHKKVYDTAIRTLKLCMHEHYEDCPWREQALYNMDSRNEMLYTYYGMENPEFVASNLLLMSKGMREDGLLSICFPSGLDYPIPSFNLVYPIQVCEYVQQTGDSELLQKVYPVMQKVLNTFICRMENDLVPNFTSGDIWNFYEWNEKLDGREQNTSPSFDCILNGFFALSLASMAECSYRLGKINDANYYKTLCSQVRFAMYNTFYDHASECYCSYVGKFEDDFSELANSLAVLNYLGTEEERQKICDRFTVDDNGMTKITLSMKVYKFDAMLSVSKQKYANRILEEIDRDFGYMLQEGATTFWETIKGEADFCGAGSLCHGWSALPICYYRILMEGEDIKSFLLQQNVVIPSTMYNINR